jgi:hypothetical protein
MDAEGSSLTHIAEIDKRSRCLAYVFLPCPPRAAKSPPLPIHKYKCTHIRGLRECAVRKGGGDGSKVCRGKPP